jgi:protein-S-isoprenylcysteine O-methyltransferase Ste14
MAEPIVTLFGPLDTVVGPYVEHVVLVLVVANFVTRKLANDRHRRQAAEAGAEAVSRHPLHVASTWLLVLVTFYYLTLHHHSGVVLASLVLGLFLADFFEFEARKVEAREDRAIETPKGAITAAGLTLLYSAYLSLFFVVQPLWNSVV